MAVGLEVFSGAATVRNSIVSQNADSLGQFDDIGAPGNPTALSVDYSLIGYSQFAFLPETPTGTPDVRGNQVGGAIRGAINPLLGPLADNGGPTPTYALLAGSPAIDRGDPGAVPVLLVSPFDQRQMPFVRISGGRIDIGAYESQPDPRKPDLIVTHILGTSILGNRLTVNWTAKNQGTTPTTGSWTDRVWLSSDTTFGNDTLLGDLNLDGSLLAGQSVTRTATFTLQPGSIGTKYLIVRTDDSNSISETNDGNNTFISSQALNVPDLVPDSISASTNQARFGQALDVSWVVRNRGTSATAGSWNDRIWFSSQPVLDGSARLLATVPAQLPGPLAIGSSYTQSTTVTLPIDSSLPAGNYYFIVETDGLGGQSELAELNETNNRLTSAAVAFTLPDLPDLVVSIISAPLETLSGQSIPINWTIKNQGSAATNATFVDQIFLSSDRFAGGDELLGSFAYTGGIPAGQTIARTASVDIPFNAHGIKYIIVRTDSDDSIVELGDSSNNVSVDDGALSVILAPVPNLQVTKATAPPSGFSGQSSLIEWTVTNNGTGPTNVPSWRDQVYLSSDTTFDGTDTLLNAAENASFLDVGGSYQNSLTVTLPNGLNGQFYFIIVTDGENNVFEFANENDNSLASGPIGVVLTPPPDLRVSSVQAPATAFSGQLIAVSWTVVNAGLGATRSVLWRDSLYLSTDNAFDDNDVLLTTVEHSGPLNPNQQYAGTTSITLPVGISGTRYFIVRTDVANEVFEHVFEGNNTGVEDTPTTVILTPPPDLEVETVDAPTAATAGRALTVNYRVKNSGSTATPNSSWEDRLYFSSDALFDPATDKLVQSRSHTGTLDTGASYDGSFTGTLPNSLVGSFFAFVVTDFGDLVFELDNANNVKLDSTLITISSRSADLAVVSLSAPATVQAGGSILVNWQVTNNGIGDTAVTSWIDKLVISRDSSLSVDDSVLTTKEHIGLLAPGANYAVNNLLVEIPYSLAGSYFLFLVTDSNNAVFETGNEGNNSSLSAPLVVSRQTADLQVTQITAPAMAASGQQIALSWTVQNFGAGVTNANYWNDAVYLSPDPFISASDIRLNDVQHSNVLSANGRYTASANLSVPISLVGNYFVLIRTDADNRVFEDSGETNNDGGATVATAISLSPTPDLSVIGVDAPTQSFSGQSFTLTWTAQNGGAATGNASWYDSIYLSLDQNLDVGSDIYLDSVIRSGSLSAGGRYTQTATFKITAGIAGRFWVFVSADSTDRIYERDGESNNVDYDPFSMDVALPPPADLVAGAITIPPDSGPGQNATISYTIRNQGQNAARGRWTDVVYVSADEHWDISDKLFGRVEHNGDVAAGGSYGASLTAALPGVLPGDYHVIVRSDIRNWVPEANESNNLAASLDSFQVDVPSLTLGVPVGGQLAPTNPMFYKVNVPAGQTLAVTLDSQATNSANELYVARGRVPSRSDLTFRSPRRWRPTNASSYRLRRPELTTSRPTVAARARQFPLSQWVLRRRAKFPQSPFRCL